MTPKTLIKHTALTAGMIGAASLGSLTLSTASYAATIDFNTWNSVGNVSIPGLGQAVLSTDPSFDNFSGDLEAALGLDLNTYPLNNPPGSLATEDSAYQGSALSTTISAGETLSFNWNFDQFSPDKDYAFILFNGVREILASSDSNNIFSRTFTTFGVFSIGVVDIGDYSGNSDLKISNADLTPIPTPALLPGLIGMGIGVLRKRKVTASK